LILLMRMIILSSPTELCGQNPSRKEIRFGFPERRSWLQESVIIFGLWKNYSATKDNYQYIMGSLPEYRINLKMKLNVIFIPALLLSIFGNIQEINIPDSLIMALWGAALFTIAAFIKRKKGLR